MEEQNQSLEPSGTLECSITMESMKEEIERLEIEARVHEMKSIELREKAALLRSQDPNHEQDKINPKKKNVKRLRFINSPKGTDQVKESQEPMGMTNWRILGELNAKATKAMQKHIESNPVMMKRAALMETNWRKREAARKAALANGTGQPREGKFLDQKRGRYDSGQVYSDIGVMVDKGLFPNITSQKAFPAIEWGKDMRNSWGHFNFVKLLKHPRNYLSALMTIFGPAMIDNEEIYNECQVRLNQSGWNERKVLPPKVPEN